LEIGDCRDEHSRPTRKRSHRINKAAKTKMEAGAKPRPPFDSTLKPARSRCGVYGVRSAVTSRASRIMPLEPATFRQEAWKFGQACCEQSRAAVWMSSRSALARACGTLASTCGAKPGSTVRAVPCHWPLRPVVKLGRLIPGARFRLFSRKAQNGFIPPALCFVVTSGRNTAASHRRRGYPLSGSGQDRKEIGLF
jgi:hypothetical protein